MSMGLNKVTKCVLHELRTHFHSELVSFMKWLRFALFNIKSLVFSCVQINIKYSGDLNTELVGHSNSRKEVGCQMV